MALRTAVTVEPVPSHVSALDYVIGPALDQGHAVTLYGPLMFRREARRRVEFRRAGTDWTGDPAVERAASGIWREAGNASFNRYVFGRLRPDHAEAKARDLIAAWTRSRPDLVIAECSDPGAQLPWFFRGPPAPAARAVRRAVAELRTELPAGLDRPPSARPLVYVSLGTLTTRMSGLRGTVAGGYREITAAVCAISVVEHVPQPALPRRADLFVTHGGRASLLDALSRLPTLEPAALLDGG